MRKLQLLCLLTIISLTSAFAQEDCTDIKAKLTSKEAVIVKQQEEIKYYKETLNLLNSKILVKQDDFILKINSVDGLINPGKITIEGLVENKSAMRAFCPSYKTAIYDAKGNMYKSPEVRFGKEGDLWEFQKNLPVKITITFDKIGEEMPVISNFTFVATNCGIGQYTPMVFKNLPVEWK